MDTIRFIFLVLLIAALGYLSLLIMMPFATYLMAAALLAFMLQPLQARLAPHIGRRPSAFVLVIFAIGAAVAPLVIIGYLIIDAVEEAVEGVDQIAIVTRIEEIIESFTGFEIDVMAEIEQVLNQLAEAALGEITDFLAATFHFALGMLLLVFVLFYLIIDGPGLIRWIISVTPMDDELQSELFQETHLITWAVLKSHIFVAIIEGILMGIGFYMAGVPNAAFWTAIMIVLAILPIVGAVAIWAPAVIFLLYIGAIPFAVFLFIYGAIILNIENYIRALLVDREAELHPAIVLIGVLGGLYVFGILGLFIGPIVLAIFKATLNVFGRLTPMDGAGTV